MISPARQVKLEAEDGDARPEKPALGARTLEEKRLARHQEFLQKRGEATAVVAPASETAASSLPARAGVTEEAPAGSAPSNGEPGTEARRDGPAPARLQSQSSTQSLMDSTTITDAIDTLQGEANDSVRALVRSAAWQAGISREGGFTPPSPASVQETTRALAHLSKIARHAGAELLGNLDDILHALHTMMAQSELSYRLKSIRVFRDFVKYQSTFFSNENYAKAIGTLLQLNVVRAARGNIGTRSRLL
jgi:hypothetical protein